MLDGAALFIVAFVLEQVRALLGHAHHGLLHVDVALALVVAVLVYSLFAGLVRRLERRGAGLGVVVQTVDFGARPHLCGLLLHAALPGADLTTHCTVGVVLAVVGHVVGLIRVVELTLTHHLQAVVHIGLAQWVAPGVGSELAVVSHHELIDGIGAQGLFDFTALAGGHTAAGDCTHCLEQHLGTTVAQQLLLELLRQQGNHLVGHALPLSAFGLWVHRALHALQQGIEERFGGRVSLLTQALDYRRSGLAQGQAHVLGHRVQHVQGGTGTHGVAGAFMACPTLGHVADLVGQRAGIVGQPIDVAGAVGVCDAALGLDPRCQTTACFLARGLSFGLSGHDLPKQLGSALRRLTAAQGVQLKVGGVSHLATLGSTLDGMAHLLDDRVALDLSPCAVGQRLRQRGVGALLVLLVGQLISDTFHGGATSEHGPFTGLACGACSEAGGLGDTLTHQSLVGSDLALQLSSTVALQQELTGLLDGCLTCNRVF